MSAVAWLEREIERVTKRRRDDVAPPLTPPTHFGVPVATLPQQPQQAFMRNAPQYSSGSSANSMHARVPVPAMNDADVRRAEHPEEFRCAHGIWPGTYCGMCKRMI